MQRLIQLQCYINNIKMDYIKKEWKKLGSIILMGMGFFLLAEHTYTYGGIDLWDLLGHETFGLVLFLAGVLCANRWGRLKMEEGLSYTLEKLKYVFNIK